MTVELRHLDVNDLTSSAGGDPWDVDRTVQAGAPGEISELANSFRAASNCTQETTDEFLAAQERFASAWDRHDGGDHPINDSEEVRRATESMNYNRDKMANVAVDLANIAASLAEAQRSGAISISNLEAALQGIDNQIDHEIGVAAAKGETADVSALRQAAVDRTAAALSEVQSVRDAYSNQLDDSRAQMAAEGYSPNAMASSDGEGDAPTNAQAQANADKYGTSQRAADEALVNSPGPWTPEKQSAAGRLRDYTAINNPTASIDEVDFAGQRLNDYHTSQFVGPLPADTVLGGNAQTRAQARLQMQQTLESANAFPGKPSLTPDQATQLLNQWESNGRQMVLGQFATQLQAVGVSPEGTAQAISEIQNGKAPSQVIRDATADLTNYAGALAEGAKAHAGALPGGGHWGNAPVWSHADVEALKGFGSKLGMAGTVVDAMVTGYDVANGAPLGEEAAQFGGRTLGSIGGGFAAGAAWGSLVGPEGTLIVGFLGAIGGGIGGEKFVNVLLGK
jgi:hypothetical protein